MALHKLSLVVIAITAAAVVGPGSGIAAAFEFTRPLQHGDVSPEVAQLEKRVVGWFPKNDQTVFVIDDLYDGQTRWAVKRFQRHYGLAEDGIAGEDVFEVLDRLEDDDGSTVHFDYSEFWQNRNRDCSKLANSYAGTFRGGSISARWVKLHVTNVMWRLEAIRARGGGNPIGINSGFRSVAYNRCIGGASLSQHTYGTAADTVMVGVTSRRQRDLARTGQVYGIGCYSSLSHNHLDLRLQNTSLPQTSSWWWPRQDRYRRDLDSASRPCLGETKHIVAGRYADAPVPSADEVEAWEDAGEVPLNGAD